MRSSGCTIQQALTPEAANMVKQAVNLARRRGHAQVTPLHVANTMLSSSSGLFRAACLQSHSHPLQCRALELCFNVALNRLPTSTSSPMLGPHYHHHHQNPAISNALVAAFKRAQAHQRRGSIETQQQPLLAVKIELEQLIISILDDPSVSRVMREAGFSSPLVKEKVEQAVSLEVNSSDQLKVVVNKDNTSTTNLLVLQPGVKDDDVASVMEGMLNSKRKRCCVVVGECLATLEGAVKGVMDRVQSGDVHVPDALREVRFEPLSLDSLGSLSKEQLLQKFADITCLVKRYASKGLVFYLGDLKWAAEFISGGGLDQRRSYYCPIQHVIMELKRLVQECNETGRLWLVGVATFQTHTRCGSGHPSLEAIWGIHPIMIPPGSLGLSLVPESESDKKVDNGPSWLLHEGSREEKHRVSNSESTTQSLPSWLQKCKEDENKRSNDTDQDLVLVNYVCKRSWSFTETTLSFSVVSPSSPPTGFSYDQQQRLNTQQIENRTESKCFWATTDNNHLSNRMSKPSFRTYMPEPNSTSSSDIMEVECTQKRFKDCNSENLETLCNALEQRVPWQRNIIRDIVSTVLSCRSGRARRKSHSLKEETWLFFLGADSVGKEKIARELAMLVFGSQNRYNAIALSSFSSTEDSRNKRLRDEKSSTCIDKLAEAVANDPHRLFFVEDVEQVDYVSQVGIKRAIERGKLRNSNGEEVSLGDSIIILSCERFSSRSRACSPEEKGGACSEDSNGNSTSPTISLDLNMSISDDCCVDQDQSSTDQLGLLAAVDKCVLFKLEEF